MAGASTSRKWSFHAGCQPCGSAECLAAERGQDGMSSRGPEEKPHSLEPGLIRCPDDLYYDGLAGTDSHIIEVAEKREKSINFRLVLRGDVRRTAGERNKEPFNPADEIGRRENLQLGGVD